MRVISLQKALPVVAGMIADRTHVPVVVGRKACTNGKVVCIPPLPIDLSHDDFMMAVAMVYHEVFHILYSNFALEYGAVLQKAVAQALEDIRIEAKGMRSYPGARLYLSHLVVLLTQYGQQGKAGFAPVDPAEPQSRILQSYILYKLRHDLLDQHAVAPVLASAEAAAAVWPVPMRTRLDALMFEVERCETEDDVFALAEEIVRMIEEEELAERERQRQESGTPLSDQPEASEAERDREASSESAPPQPELQPAADHSNVLQAMLDAVPEEVIASAGDIVGQLLNQTSEATGYSELLPSNLRPFPLPSVAADTSPIKASINAIRFRTLAFLASACDPDSMPSYAGTEINFAALHGLRFGAPVFLQEDDSTLVDKGLRTDMLFLVDRSGSMDREIRLALTATLAAILAYKVRGIDSQVAVFPVEGEFDGLNETNAVGLVKSWSESPQVMAGRLTAIDADGGTPMAEAILWASCELARRPPARRMLVVITDGMPDRPDAAHRCIEIARGNGIHVLGLGIGAASHAPAVFGESFSAQIERVDQLTGAMVKLVRSMLH